MKDWEQLAILPADDPRPPDQIITPPASLIAANSAATDWRLRPDLAAAACRPHEAFARAAALWAKSPTDARAFAEVTVTGRSARALYEYAKPSADDVVSWAAQLGLNATSNDAAAVLAYVAKVCAFIDTPSPDRPSTDLAKLHGGVPWLANYGEGAPPGKPINVATTKQKQREVGVVLRGRRIATRYVSHGAGGGPVVLFLHGLGSRLEESEAVRDVLTAGNRLTAVALDLLGNGYTERVPLSAFGVDRSTMKQETFSLLPLMDEFVQAFVEALGIGSDLRLVVGGSLGGTLAVRQAMADQQADSHRRYFAWSPACCWESMARYDCIANGVEQRVGDRLRKAEHQVWTEAEPPMADTRHDFLYFNFDEHIPNRGPVATTWWSDHIGQDLKRQYIAASREDRREQLDECMRQWNLGLAYEQCFYSYAEKDPADGYRPRFEVIRRGTALIVGSDDHQPFSVMDIAASVASLVLGDPDDGRPPSTVPGWYGRLKDTGHSIHDEHPRTLADLIARFHSAEL